MEQHFAETIKRLAYISENFTGSEKNFESEIKKLILRESAINRADLCIKGTYHFDVQRAAVMELVPVLEKISSMKDLRNFLNLQAVKTYKTLFQN